MIDKTKTWTTIGLFTALLSTLFSTGCMDRELRPLGPCLVSGVTEQIAVEGVDKIDLLFVIDSSPSMIDEQAKLKAEIPRLVKALTTGTRRDGSTFPPAEDINLGVISTHMGLPGVPEAADNPDWQCVTPTINGPPHELGDDGVLRSTPGSDWQSRSRPQDTWAPDPQCATSYPKFINYQASQGEQGVNQATADLSCLAQVGPGGCGFEMQLEAALKALTPSTDVGRQFLTDSQGAGTLGHGDGLNAGFLRSDPSQGVSLVAVIIVTDEDDCSSRTTEHLHPVDPAKPSKYDATVPNLRCYHHKENLWAVERYVNGLRALRPGQEQLVLFGAITGVPPAMVSAERLSHVDFDDDTARHRFYEELLAHEKMQEVPVSDVAGPPKTLAAACETETDRGKSEAKPARRIVETVRGFGSNGILQSICQENFSGAIDRIVDAIGDRVVDLCLPRPLVRNSEGTVECKVVWELPPPEMALSGTPTACDDMGFPFLQEPEDPAKRVSGSRTRCEVLQLPVLNRTIPEGTGWYYDDFTAAISPCMGKDRQRITFTKPPPGGINVKLECLNEIQSVPDARRDIDLDFYRRQETSPPHIGTECFPNGGACSVRRLGGAVDESSLFCHATRNVCAQGCQSDTQCPAGWRCDTRPETVSEVTGAGRAMCVNPICGID